MGTWINSLNTGFVFHFGKIYVLKCRWIDSNYVSIKIKHLLSQKSGIVCGTWKTVLHLWQKGTFIVSLMQLGNASVCIFFLSANPLWEPKPLGKYFGHVNQKCIFHHVLLVRVRVSSQTIYNRSSMVSLNVAESKVKLQMSLFCLL